MLPPRWRPRARGGQGVSPGHHSRQRGQAACGRLWTACCGPAQSCKMVVLAWGGALCRAEPYLVAFFRAAEARDDTPTAGPPLPGTGALGAASGEDNNTGSIAAPPLATCATPTAPRLYKPHRPSSPPSLSLAKVPSAPETGTALCVGVGRGAAALHKLARPPWRRPSRSNS